MCRKLSSEAQDQVVSEFNNALEAGRSVRVNFSREVVRWDIQNLREYLEDSLNLALFVAMISLHVGAKREDSGEEIKVFSVSHEGEKLLEILNTNGFSMIKSEISVRLMLLRDHLENTVGVVIAREFIYCPC